MRQAGNLPPEADAERLADYLLTLGIKTRIDRHDAGYMVWVKDEQDVERGKQELATYLANPGDARYKLAEDGARAIRKDLDLKEQQYRKNLVNVRRGWAQPFNTRARVTSTLIITCVVIFVLSLFGNAGDRFQEWLQITSVTRVLRTSVIGVAPLDLPPEIMHGQLWRLLTPILIHFNPLHIAFNMLMLQNMGTLIETREGTRRMLALVLASALISNLGQYYLGPVFDLHVFAANAAPLIDRSFNFGGMSGVDYALFGYLWIRGRSGRAGYMLHPNTVLMMLGWLVLCLIGMIGSIANGAHVFGLVVGMIAAYWVNEH